MLRPIIFTFFALLTLLPGRMTAQATFSVSYDSLAISPSTVNYGDSIIITFLISNSGNAAYTGDIDILRRQDSLTTYSLGLLSGVTLNPGDSILFTGTDNIVPQRYGGGINILVIWPTAAAGGVATLDTVYGSVLVLDTLTKVHDAIAPGQRATLFPNPVSQYLNIRYSQDGPRPVGIRISDLSGRVLLNRKHELTGIRLDAFARGMYLLEIEYENGRKQYARIQLKN